jgi:hypothetical protein
MSEFEPSTLEKATHIEVNGVRHKLNDNVQYFRNGDLLGIRWRDEYTFIPEELFSTLGIKLLREIKPEPIEFEATFIKHDGKWYPSYSFSLDDSNYQNNKKARFKCVEILEDEE